MEEINIDVDDELKTRMQYAEFVGDITRLMMDLAVPGIWLQEILKECDDFSEYDPQSLRESLTDMAIYLQEKLHKMLLVIQKSSVNLYGEELPSEAFHVSDCSCGNH